MPCGGLRKADGHTGSWSSKGGGSVKQISTSSAGVQGQGRGVERVNSPREVVQREMSEGLVSSSKIPELRSSGAGI